MGTPIVRDSVKFGSSEGYADVEIIALLAGFQFRGVVRIVFACASRVRSSGYRRGCDYCKGGTEPVFKPISWHRIPNLEICIARDPLSLDRKGNPGPTSIRGLFEAFPKSARPSDCFEYVLTGENCLNLTPPSCNILAVCSPIRYDHLRDFEMTCLSIHAIPLRINDFRYTDLSDLDTTGQTGASEIDHKPEITEKGRGKPTYRSTALYPPVFCLDLLPAKHSPQHANKDRLISRHQLLGHHYSERLLRSVNI